MVRWKTLQVIAIFEPYRMQSALKQKSVLYAVLHRLECPNKEHNWKYDKLKDIPYTSIRDPHASEHIVFALQANWTGRHVSAEQKMFTL
jgi:hypothetical protein